MSSRQNVFPDSVCLQTAQQDYNFPEEFPEEDIIGWPDTSTILDVDYHSRRDTIEVNEGSVAYDVSSTNVEPTSKDENSSQTQNWFSGSVGSIFLFIHSASYHQVTVSSS